MILIRSFIFNITLILWSVSAAIVLTPVAIIEFLLNRKISAPFIWIRFIMFMARYILGITHEIKGKEHIIKDKSVIYAAKHQSAWETLIFYLIVNDPVYVLKRELFMLPIVGQYLKYMIPCIAIKRQDGATALKSLIKQSDEHLEKGRQVIIFPEGTRKDISAKPDYNNGIAMLYKRNNCNVVPVALNSGVFWKRNAFVKYPGKITIEFLPAIERGLDKNEFMRILESRIETSTSELLVMSD